MSTRTPDAAAPFFDVADPAFCVTTAEVRRAREAGWYARTSYGLAVLRYDQVSRLIRHPALRQGSRLWPAHHGITSRAVRGLVGQLGSQPGGRGASQNAPPVQSGLLPPDRRGPAPPLRRSGRGAGGF